jgi:hypothetical protein
MRAERPDAGETIPDDDEPGPPAVDLQQDERGEERGGDL